MGVGLWSTLPKPEAVARTPTPVPLPPAAGAGAAGALRLDGATFLFLYVDGCVQCDRVRSLVEELKEKEGGGIRFEVRSAYDEEVEVLAERHFSKDNHGALALAADGRAVWKAEGHPLTREMLSEGIAALRRDR